MKKQIKIERLLVSNDIFLLVSADNGKCVSLRRNSFHDILKIKIMGLIKEPREIDFSTKSEPWTEKELVEFRKIMQGIKNKNAKQKERLSNLKKRDLESA